MAAVIVTAWMATKGIRATSQGFWKHLTASAMRDAYRMLGQREMYVDPRELPSTHVESLPFAHVTYHGLYSTFIRFAPEAGADTHFCLCGRDAMLNHLAEVMAQNRQPRPFTNDRMSEFRWFPTDNARVRRNRTSVYRCAQEVIDALDFTDSLCHRCNLAVPSIEYGYELCFKRTSFFAQRFGFYIQQWLYQNGFTGWGDPLHPDKPNPAVSHLLALDVTATRKLLTRCLLARGDYPQAEDDEPPLSWHEEYQLRERFRKQQQSVCAFAESEVRKAFGFPAQGKLAQAEHLVLMISRRIYSSVNVQHRAHPEWLKGLELDIFIPHASLALEYQGHQHSDETSFMHADERSFASLKERDQRKKDICARHGITIAYFDETDFITEALVKRRIDEAQQAPAMRR